MAITKIKAIRSTLYKAINYICNPEKTQGKLLVDSSGCVPEFAAQQMEATAKKNKRGGCRKAYHLMQSFAPTDNITPEQALKIGKEFADKVTRGKHEYVISVHTDRDHIHCHIIFNAFDMNGHGKYRYKKYGERDRIRDISDKLCRDNGLSVLPRWTKEETWTAKLKAAIDRAVLDSETFEEFITAMEMEGYTFKDGKHIAFIADGEGQKKYTRCYSIGDYYTEEMIRDRIANKEKYRDADLSLQTKKKKSRETKTIPESEVPKKEEHAREKTAAGDTTPVSDKESGQDPANDRNEEKRSGFAGNSSHTRNDRKRTLRTDRQIRLIHDLSENIKAQNSPGYRHVAEKNNLNMFVRTMNFLTQHDIETPERFQEFYESCYKEVTGLNREIQNVDMAITELGERRSYIRKFFKNQRFYNTFMKYKNMNYYREHENEIREFELSKTWLERSGVNPRTYKHQEYQEEYNRLRSRKNALYEKLGPAKALLYDTGNVMKNIESVLGITIYEDEKNQETQERNNDAPTEQHSDKKER